MCFGSFASLLTYLSMSAIRPIADLQFEVANTETAVIQAPEPGPRTMRYELTDFEWAAIRPFLPNKPHGVARSSRRRSARRRNAEEARWVRADFRQDRRAQ